MTARIVWIYSNGQLSPNLWHDDDCATAERRVRKECWASARGEIIAEHQITDDESSLSFDELAKLHPPPGYVSFVEVTIPSVTSTPLPQLPPPASPLRFWIDQ